MWNTFIYLEKQEELLLRIIEHADQCLSTFTESLGGWTRLIEIINSNDSKQMTRIV